jgi:NADH-quinone oxidoreductase subunit C
VVPSAIVERLAALGLTEAVVARGEVTVVVERNELLEVLRRLGDDPDLAIDWLSDVSATHWLDRVPACWVAYHLASRSKRHRLRVKVPLSEDDPVVPSVTGRFPTADWMERELYDLHGVRAEGHPDLRRILMPDDWEGHPLRKDYALGGVGTQYKGAFIPPVDERSS